MKKQDDVCGLAREDIDGVLTPDMLKRCEPGEDASCAVDKQVDASEAQ